MREILEPIQPGLRILDAGGGTGNVAKIFDSGLSFYCMDIDFARLRVAKARGVSAVQGDATRMPVTDASIDLVVLRAVSHHLDDESFARMVAESRRVLKPTGSLLFQDPIWAPSRLPGRMLWRIDQGSHPRTEAQMRAVVENHFEIQRRVSFAVFHRYFLTLARPKPRSGQAAEHSR